MAAKPDIASLNALREAEAACRRCPLYKDATQVVPGEGPKRAEIMLVGEQPGDREDRAGKPFVGPAGRVLDKAIKDAGIDRDLVFVTNAVKHFKFTPRGKRRLHKRPNAYEIERCHRWLDLERRLVRPEVIVAMGATAIRSVAGKAMTIRNVRGKLLPLDNGARMLATIHPSYLLRIKEEKDKKAGYRRFVRDLRACAGALKRTV